LKLNLEQRPAR